MAELDLKNKKILVVDDTIFLRVELVHMLIKLGLPRDNVFQCGDGVEAMAHLRSPLVRFDLILSDWNMPNLTGIEFLKQVRSSNGYYTQIPFVLVTTLSEKDKVIEAIKYKVSGYLIKPITFESLKENLTRVFLGDEDE